MPASYPMATAKRAVPVAVTVSDTICNDDETRARQESADRLWIATCFPLRPRADRTGFRGIRQGGKS
jgi:hypothetical protein